MNLTSVRISFDKRKESVEIIQMGGYLDLGGNSTRVVEILTWASGVVLNIELV